MSFYLTTPIYYVNSTPHIGHAYTTIIGDILVRHHRQRGERTYFLTGVDEHADKVARVAKEQGLTPKEYVDQIAVAWQELPERVNASIDYFIRTTDEGHKAFVQEFLQKIYDNGDVYQDVYAGLYCVGCEAFKTEAELVDGKCPDHGTVPEWLEEKNWFFRLSAYEARLLQLYDERPDFVLPGFRANEARSFIAGGLRDFSISRATQTWGIPIPWDPDQVAYVWADALINYLSALSYAPEADLAFWPANHLLAKDILRFHCVYWPAMLLSAGYEPPRQLFVHGYLNLDNQKISKSLGNVLDPLDLVDEYGVDPVRFWVARVVPFGQDGDVTLDSFRERYERELAERPRQPALAHDGDDRPLPRRRPLAGARREQRARRSCARAPRRHSRRPRPLGRDRRARDDLGLPPTAEPARGADEAVGAGEGSRSRRRARSCALRARGRPSDRGGRAVGLPARDVGADPRDPGPAARRRLGERRVRPHRSDLRDRAGAAALPADRRARYGGVA